MTLTSLTVRLLVVMVGALALPGATLAQDRSKPADPPPGDHDPGGVCPQMSTNLCIPLDATFVPVDMNQPGGSGPANPADFCQRNDDDSGLLQLDGWVFDLFGTQYGEVYINNNGNLSFGQAFSTFTPSGFPVNGFPMIAPFWGDVDTGDINDTFGGVAWFRQDSINNGDAVNRLTVTWDHVGYYDEHGDKLNTFQVIITDGQDPLVGIGNNVCFCYDDMQWTTGDASGGVNGFGGAPATVGANKGNGIDFFQIGTFDHAGSDYDGPGGNPDGVSFLDDSTFCFDASGAGNAPPIFLNPPNDCLTVAVGETLMFDISATGPETGQTVTLSADAGGLANFSCTFTPGNPATASCSFTPGASQIGQHGVVFTAVDDANPPLSSDLTVCLRVEVGTFFCGGTGCPCGNDSPGAGCANSTGAGAELSASGTPSVSADDLVLTVENVPLHAFGVVYMGPNEDCAPFGDGIRAISPGPPTVGFLHFPIQNAGATGMLTEGPGIVAYSANFGMSGTITPGDTWKFQGYYRDPTGPCGTAFNLSNGFSITFVP